MVTQFAILLFLILALHMSDNALFSRFRNPNEFVAPVNTLTEDLDPDSYEDLLEEIPDLSGHMKRQRSRDPLQMPYLKNNFEQSDEYDFMMNGDFEDKFLDAAASSPSEWTLNASSSASPSLMLAGAGYNASNSSGALRFWKFLHYWRGPKKATCYACNLDYRRWIPISPICHDAFNSENWRARTLARYFRAHCYRNTYHWGVKIEPKWVDNKHHEYDRGLYRGYYGAYIGGCFKRSMDVGKVLTLPLCFLCFLSYYNGTLCYSLSRVTVSSNISIKSYGTRTQTIY